MGESAPFLEICDLGVQFPTRKGALLRRRFFYAVRKATLMVRSRETLCLVGESGSGKTSLTRAILGLCPFQEGRMFFQGKPIMRCGDNEHQRLRSRSQMVFQDPTASLDPFFTISESIEEPLIASRLEKTKRSDRVKQLAERMGLSSALLKRYPYQLSGGENQRACLARALATRPEFLIMDEPLSALDAHIRREIVKLLMELRDEYSLTYIMITHDLPLAKELASTMAVMYFGRIVEIAQSSTFFTSACHPYSIGLLSSVLRPGFWPDKRIILEGEPPSPLKPPPGCAFYARCNRRTAICEKIEPQTRVLGPGHFVACHLF
jgi:oligopeptide/dipeptide ABC transporter ATP-binding protein